MFLTHPNECIYERRTEPWKSKGITSFFRDKLRTKLKVNNLGIKSIHMMDISLKKAKRFGFQFISMEDYKNKYYKK